MTKFLLLGALSLPFQPSSAFAQGLIDDARMRAFKAAYKSALEKSGKKPCSMAPVLDLFHGLACPSEGWSLGGDWWEGEIQIISVVAGRIVPDSKSPAPGTELKLVWAARLSGAEQSYRDFANAGAIVTQAEISAANQELLKESRAGAVGPARS